MRSKKQDFTPEQWERKLQWLREDRRLHPEKYKKYDKLRYDTRNRALRQLKKYGLDEEGYQKLLHRQGGVCAICQGPPNGKGHRYHVDHDHRTGRVRGLLCSRCNTMIGHALENPDILRAGATYVAERSGTELEQSPDPTAAEPTPPPHP